MYKEVAFLLSFILLLAGCKSTAVSDKFDAGGGQPMTSESGDVMSPIEDSKVKLAIGEWPPYMSESYLEGGVTTKIVVESFKLAGVEVELEYMNWTRAYKLVAAGDYLGTYPWGYLEYRKEEFLFTDVIMDVDENFYYIEGNTKVPEDFTTYEAIDSLVIGGITDYSHVQILESQGITLDLASNEIEGLTKLLNGRIDLLPLSYEVAQNQIEMNFPDDVDRFKYLKTPHIHYEMGLLIGKRHPEAQWYVQKFNEGIKLLKESGEFERIISQFTK